MDTATGGGHSKTQAVDTAKRGGGHRKTCLGLVPGPWPWLLVPSPWFLMLVCLEPAIAILALCKIASSNAENEDGMSR